MPLGGAVLAACLAFGVLVSPDGLAVQSVTMPRADDPPATLTLTILIEKDGAFRLAWDDAKTGEPRESTKIGLVESAGSACTSGCVRRGQSCHCSDFTKLTSELKGLVLRLTPKPGPVRLVLAADPTVRYELVVLTIDAVRSVSSEIVLAQVGQ